MFYLHVYVMGDGKRQGRISIDNGPIVKVTEGAYYHLVPGTKHILNIYRMNKKKRPYVAWHVELDGRDNYKCGVDIPQYDNDPKHDVQAKFSYELDCLYRKKELTDWASAAYGSSSHPYLEGRLREDGAEFNRRMRANESTIARWTAIKKDGKPIPFRKLRLTFLKPVGFALLLPALCFMPDQFFPIGPMLLALSILSFITYSLVNSHPSDKKRYQKERKKMLNQSMFVD